MDVPKIIKIYKIIYYHIYFQKKVLCLVYKIAIMEFLEIDKAL